MHDIQLNRAGLTRAAATVWLTFALASCGGEQDPSTSSSTAENSAPVISGSPGTTATAGVPYSFQPTATDPDGDALSYSVENMPGWATFSIATGRISGTPAAADVGTYANIRISVSDGNGKASLPPFTITVASSGSGNVPPTISGQPALAAVIGAAYSFKPVASDANGDTLTFSVESLPEWASFNSATGLLSGTPGPSHRGTYSNIVISVSDGETSAALPPFSILVSEMGVGSATLSWAPPTSNEDGSSLANLAGYRIHYGTSPDALNQVMTVANPGLASYTVTNLGPGTWYFSVTAYTPDGTESAYSNLASKTVL